MTQLTPNFISIIASVVEFIGAALMVLPDIPVVRGAISPTTLEEARRELFDKTSLIKGNQEFDAILTTVESKWEGVLHQQPWLLLMDKPHLGVETSLFAVYDEESHGPYGDLKQDGGFRDIPDEYDSQRDYIWENDKWDIICAKQTLDDWVTEELNRKNNHILTIRGIGFLLFIIGFAVQFL